MPEVKVLLNCSKHETKGDAEFASANFEKFFGNETGILLIEPPLHMYRNFRANDIPTKNFFQNPELLEKIASINDRPKGDPFLANFYRYLASKVRGGFRIHNLETPDGGELKKITEGFDKSMELGVLSRKLYESGKAEEALDKYVESVDKLVEHRELRRKNREQNMRDLLAIARKRGDKVGIWQGAAHVHESTELLTHLSGRFPEIKFSLSAFPFYFSPTTIIAIERFRRKDFVPSREYYAKAFLQNFIYSYLYNSFGDKLSARVTKKLTGKLGYSDFSDFSARLGSGKKLQVHYDSKSGKAELVFT
ncbi:MAG: hypothetical protein V1835_04750 [Candidatus Micrarchaeota archaeon]